MGSFGIDADSIKVGVFSLIFLGKCAKRFKLNGRYQSRGLEDLKNV